MDALHCISAYFIITLARRKGAKSVILFAYDIVSKGLVELADSVVIDVWNCVGFFDFKSFLR